MCVCGVLCGGCGNDAPPEAGKTAELPVIKAEVLTVRECHWPTIVRTQGSLFADEIAVVGAKVAGRVSLVHVELGDTALVNAPLATLDQEEFRLQVSQAEAQLLQARAAVGLKPDEPVEKLQPENAPPVREEKALWDEARAKSLRWQQLKTQNAVTEADLEQVIAAEEVAAARYASAVNSVNEKIALIGVRSAERSLAQQRLKDSVVLAPFDGLVQQRHVAPGSFVQVGQPIATIVRTNLLHFRGMLPERHARKLALGQQVTLQIESISDPRTAQVTRISPTLDELSRSLLFEVELNNTDGRLTTGLFAEAAVVLDESAQAIALPASAITEFAGAEKVWKVVDGQASEQIVTTGKRRHDLIEITSGVNIGDVVLWQADKGRIARVEAVSRPFEPPAPTSLPETGKSGLATESDPSATDPSEDSGGAESTGGP
jgi:RND family efflux transporter MFP subunit